MCSVFDLSINRESSDSNSMNQAGNTLKFTKVWKDPYGSAMLVIVLLLMTCGMEIPVISPATISARWVIWGLVLVMGLGYTQRIWKIMKLKEWNVWIAFLVIALISCFYSFDFFYSFARWVSLVMLLVGILWGLLGWVVIRRREYEAAEMLVIAGIMTTVIALLKGGIDLDSSESERLTGAFGKATGAGAFAAMVLPLFYWRYRYSGGIYRLILLLCMFIQTYLLVFSAARGAIVSTLIAAVGFIYIYYRKLFVIVALAGAVVVGGFLVGTLSIDMLPKRIARQESMANLTGRLEIYKALYCVMEKSPIFGYGYGIARYTIARDPEALLIYLEGDLTSRKAKNSIAAADKGKYVEILTHSEHLERLVEVGIIGYLPFLAFLVLLVIRIFKCLRRPNGVANDLAKCLGLAMPMIVLDTILHSSMTSVGNGTIIVPWIQIAMFIGVDCLLEFDQANGAMHGMHMATGPSEKMEASPSYEEVVARSAI